MQVDTVVDVGCAAWGGDESIGPLIAEFSPAVLLGYDPAAAQCEYEVWNTLVVVRPWAAWTHTGTLRFFQDGLNGHVVGSGGRDDPPPGEPTPCFDLADLILSQTGTTVLKIDAEGSEYTLLPDLAARGADRKLELLWVEWHCLGCQRGAGLHREGCADRRCEAMATELTAKLECTVRSWER